MEWSRKIGSFCFLILMIVGYATAQVAPNRYIVYFENKDNTPYSIDNPDEFLSEKAIQRRLNQGISIDEKDLPVDPANIQSIQNLGAVEIIYPLKWFNGVLIETYDISVVQAILDMENVDRLEVSTYISNDWETNEIVKYKGGQKSEEDYGPSLNQIKMLNGLGLHEDGYQGQGMWIGVLDGGFSHVNEAAAFDSLNNDNRILGTKNFVTGSDWVYEASNHGAYVLSTMAGIIQDSLIGTAPLASYFLCTTEDVATERRIEEANWAAAAEYVDSVGIDIINTSLGYTTFDFIEHNYTYSHMDGNTALITKAADIAASRGMLIVNSAGNSGDSDWNYIGAAADGDSVLAIGAVRPDSVIASFSSRGPSFDGRVKPNVVAQGQFTILSDLGDGIQLGNGTSFSSPVLTGMAACLWQAYPEATAWQIHQAIEQSAHLYNMPNDSMGYGIPNFEIARGLLSTLETGEISEHHNIKVFPNPTTDGNISIAISNDLTGKTNIKIADITGREVYQRNYSNISGNRIILNNVLNNMSTGIYILSIQNQNHNQSVRLIKTEN